MSALARVRAKYKTPSGGTSKISESPYAGSAGASAANIEIEAPPSAGFAGTAPVQIRISDNALTKPTKPPPAVDEYKPLTAEQEGAREQVLAELEANPSIRRAFCTRFEDGNLIITLAIRGIGTGELLIPAERFNQNSLDDCAALLACFDCEENA